MTFCMNILGCKKNKTPPAQAHVVDGKLVLSLPGAQTPTVWQMDLKSIKASALEVQETITKGGKGEDDKASYTLVLKKSASDKQDVAVFAAKDDALDALMVASKAMAGAHGQISGAASEGGNAAPSPRKKRGWLVPVIVIGVIILLLALLMGSMPKPANMMQQSAYAPGAGSTPSSAGQSAGVPVSADDFLRGR